ncbi:MAG: polyprenyl diphosphate synthase [Candidatus Peregrinibacteria bacterium]
MPSNHPTPLHIAIIPDGNRRWAKAQSLHPWKGHEKAIENFRMLTDWCQSDPRIGALTVWCFSTENWKRDPKEVSKLMTLLEEYIIRERPNLQKEKTRLVHSGRTDRLPASLVKLLKEVRKETEHFTEFTLNLAVDYGGKDEIIRATRKATESYQLPTTNYQLPDDPIHPFLDHPELPDIDLIIRTSGEFRTSNFFLWQSAYAEWIFTEKLFPDFTANDLEKTVEEFERRKRRFGG